MNKRINQLIAESGCFMSESPEDYKKLVELTMKECIELVFNSPKGIGSYRWKDDVALELKEHFGVE